jgi:hypothetical protein
LNCSANATLTQFNVDGNVMQPILLKSIELEFVLCQLRNPEVTEIHASDKKFHPCHYDKIGQALRYSKLITVT